MNPVYSSMAVDVSNTFHDVSIVLLFNLLCLFFNLTPETLATPTFTITEEEG